MTAFGDLVSRQLKALGMGQRELSRRTGINQGTLSMLILGRTALPEPFTARVAADALGITDGELRDALWWDLLALHDLVPGQRQERRE